MKPVLALQHVECEKPGLIEEALKSKGYAVDAISSFRGQPVPEGLGEACGLVVMGGPMGVYEDGRYPFLRDEMRLIQQALRQEKPVLGVCLGSQLLAAALGAKVRKGAQKEIGWFPIELSEPAHDDRLLGGIDRSFTALHWHGDVFDVPAGATALSSSRLTACQAFRYGRNAYGFLFHMEVTQKILDGLARTFSGELAEEGLSGDQILRQAGEFLPKLQLLGRRVFSEWANLLCEAV